MYANISPFLAYVLDSDYAKNWYEGDENWESADSDKREIGYGVVAFCALERNKLREYWWTGGKEY